MKNYFPLSPSIELIDKRLFGITEGLIEAVHRGETSLSIAEAVRNSPEWTEYQADIQEDQVQSEQQPQESHPPPVIPEHIADLIRRRVEANSLASLSLPAPGQIVSVEKIVTPRPGQLDAIMQVPLHVLLDAPAETPSIWHGWLVSAETDYASWWDFVLQEQDAPFDPEASMVQMWNPVRLYLPMAARVVGKLTPARLQAVRSLAADFVSDDAPSDVPAWPGRVASRTTTLGSRVTTGSPLSKSNDPRSRYQDIYFEAAEAVREPARLAMQALAAVPSGQLGLLFNRLIAAAGKASEILLPEPRVASAMRGSSAVGIAAGISTVGSVAQIVCAAIGSVANSQIVEISEQLSDIPDLSWPDIAKLRIQTLTSDGDCMVEVTAIGTDTIIIEVRKGSLVEERVNILPGDAGKVAWDKGSTSLTISTVSGRSFELPLIASE